MRYFYYQPGTLGEVEWKRKIKQRQTPARDIGVYNAYSRSEGWHDELLVGASESEPDDQIEALVKDAEVEGKEETEEEVDMMAGRKKKEKVERPMPRVTEADRVGDLKSLDRALTRTLYLVVKEAGRKGRWGFPCSSLLFKEHLHTVSLGQGLETAKFTEIFCLEGSRTHFGPVLGREHEHLGRWQHAYWSPNRYLPAEDSE